MWPLTLLLEAANQNDYLGLICFCCHESPASEWTLWYRPPDSGTQGCFWFYVSVGQLRHRGFSLRKLWQTAHFDRSIKSSRSFRVPSRSLANWSLVTQGGKSFPKAKLFLPSWMVGFGLSQAPHLRIMIGALLLKLWALDQPWHHLGMQVSSAEHLAPPQTC